MTSLRVVLALACLGALITGCYSSGEGSSPPGKSFYFPVGLAVSKGGNVLYAANSDFDLQWNGGTVQSYDLHKIRRDAAYLIDHPPAGCPADPRVFRSGNSGARQELGETCSPAVDSSIYVRDSAIIGAFATDLQLLGGGRLFIPVRGDTSLTWLDVAVDNPGDGVPDDPNAAFAPFQLQCGTRVSNRCDTGHHAGVDINEQGNSRHLTMPGEPFGMAASDDQTFVLITHQADTKTSLFATGLPAQPRDEGGVPEAQEAATASAVPSLQYILDGLPPGGIGLAAIPHLGSGALCASEASGCEPAPPAAFLQSSRSVAEISLLRYYSDEGYELSSSLGRPFLVKEASYAMKGSVGADSRGVAIDSSQRLACLVAAQSDSEKAACAKLPARIFVANRSPASLLLGEVGGISSSGDNSFDLDKVILAGNIPLSNGPSNLYLAPIVDAQGRYALRLWIVCFDASVIYVYNPETKSVENIIHVGQGPYALAFDPYTPRDVALRNEVQTYDRDRDAGLKAYRFAYVASFTNSFVQVIDLDDSRLDKATFETVVYTLGTPTNPKGT